MVTNVYKTVNLSVQGYVDIELLLRWEIATLQRRVDELEAGSSDWLRQVAQLDDLKSALAELRA